MVGIGLILELSNINKNIADFDETEKVLTNSETLGGNQQVTFLTEKGLYKVLFKSRKPIAEKFQNWVCEVIKEIRLKGQYKLNEEIKELHANLEQKDNTIQKKRTKPVSVAETFVFHACQFSDCAKVLNTVLLKEYQKWKKSIGKPTGDGDMKELKDYLNVSPYALKATVWTDKGNNEGYYGLALKIDNVDPQRVVSASTGKRVEKRVIKTNDLLGTWVSIAKAAQAENMCAAKMSRSIKSKAEFGDYYYCLSNTV